jgi:hypothetical protein
LPTPSFHIEITKSKPDRFDGDGECVNIL